MAACEHIQGMYDVALKSRLLRWLLREYVPDEKYPFRNHSGLSHVVSTVKTHQLLSEGTSHSTDQKLIDSWKSAVDAWVNRIMALASSEMPDKSWAGICLLGLTCQECNSERFLASYSVWFIKIFSHIQPPSNSHLVRVASCAALSDLVTRWDGTSHATKLVQPILKLLNEGGSDVVWEEAVCLLCVIINIFPSSVGRHYDNVEASIVSKLISENCNASILKKLSHALALLPKSRGDEDSWSLMMQKILLFLNNQLNDLFQGLEEDITRLLTEYFKTCALPELRVKVYLIVKVLLMSMGVGIAIYLIQEIINNAFIDLVARDQQRRSTDSAAYSKASEEAIQQPSRRKRKHPTTTGSLGDQSNQGGPEVERSQNLTPLVVRIAALEALEALLTVGGALGSDSWRSSVDHLTMTVATNACKGGWGREKSTSVYCYATPIWADFQLAALHALLATLLSPGHVRLPHLAESLDLFCRSTQETGTKIAEYCSHALLTLEVLIHPRALPMIHFQSPVDHYDGAGIKVPENIYSSGRGQKTPVHVGTAGEGPSVAESDEDELYQSWLRNGDEKEVPLADLQNNARNAEEASRTSKHPSFEKVTGDFPSGTNRHQVNKLRATAVDATVQISGDRDEMMIEFQNQETIKQLEGYDRTKSGNSVSIIGTLTTVGSDKAASDGGTLEHMDPASTSAKDVFVAEGEVVATVDNITAPTIGKDVKTSHSDGYNTIMENISESVSNTDSRKVILYEMDDDSSVESLPDIVDGDPDSD